MELKHLVVHQYLVSILIIGGLLGTKSMVYGQSLDYYKGTDCAFNTYSNITSGCTTNNYIFVQYEKFPRSGLDLPAGWTLKIKANGDFSNGTATIPAEYVAIGFNSIDGGPSGVSGTGNQTLSKITPAALIATTTPLQSPPHYYFVHKLNMIVTGGEHLMVGTGSFSTTATLTLVANDGNIVATNSNVILSFTVNFSNSCNGVTLNSYSSNQYTFSDYNSQMAGATITDAVSLQYAPNTAACFGWSVKIRAQGDFVNGSNSVPAAHFALRFNRVSNGTPTAAQIGVTNNPVTLTTSDVPIISNSGAGFTPHNGTEHKFDLIIAGGNHLIVANGTYRATVVFTLYNQNNEVIATQNQQLSFQINSSINNYTVQLQNTANLVDMVFNTNGDFTNGISVTKTRGLKVTGYNPYQVFVKTTTVNLVNAASNTIPVEVVNVEATVYTAITGTITTSTKALSTADQVIIGNTVANYTQQVVEYNLRYFINGNDNRIADKSGTFSTSVLYIAVPQ